MPSFLDGVVANAATLNALAAGIDNLTTYALGATSPRSYVPQVKLRRAAAQSLTNATNTAISWDTADSNPDGMWSSGAPTVVTIKSAGSYAGIVEVGFANNTTGTRTLWVCKNGTAPATNSVSTWERPSATLITGRGLTARSMFFLPACAVNDTVSIVVLQNSGGALNTATILPVPHLALWRTGP